jgi:hypothetical protein
MSPEPDHAGLIAPFGFVPEADLCAEAEQCFF